MRVVLEDFFFAVLFRYVTRMNGVLCVDHSFHRFTCVLVVSCMTAFLKLSLVSVFPIVGCFFKILAYFRMLLLSENRLDYDENRNNGRLLCRGNNQSTETLFFPNIYFPCNDRLQHV